MPIGMTVEATTPAEAEMKPMPAKAEAKAAVAMEAAMEPMPAEVPAPSKATVEAAWTEVAMAAEAAVPVPMAAVPHRLEVLSMRPRYLLRYGKRQR
jgi:hypothetical protein